MKHTPIIEIPNEDPAVLSRRERKKRNQKFTIMRAAQPLFEEKGYDVINFGTDSAESFDYPLAATVLAKAIQNKEADMP